MNGRDPQQPAACREEGLRAVDLSLHYPGGAPIIAHLDVAIAPHAFTTIVGPNGCGKSTLLKALSRVLSPQGGAVLLDGREAAGYAPKAYARQVGFLPQSSTAPEGITVAELVGRGRYPHQSLLQWTSEADRAAVREAMARTDVAELAGRRVAELSGGQRQRVWIAMALAQQTEILLLDEPTTYLDLAHQIDVLELCHELNTRFGTTVVAVLHDLNEACRYADRIIVMKDGRIVTSGEPGAAITPATVREAFGLEVRVIEDPVTGTPLVLPLRAGKRRSAAASAAA
ncbi:ABC transporter ATP-binding protein [Burkholderia gladioli]|uniref:ABC transporter ATP-binding protein n=1 Tax=Burkholderia gladioli TaxID=28095 RepID=UPI001641DFF2|nr:ABC transporter ATP-binding protein [Burkholderia gladioli]